MTTVAIIPARGQSRALPHKNLRRLAGRPLIAHTIEAARRSTLVDRVVVSTDDDAIARAARAEGAEVPFRRPARLATDTAQTVDAVIHAVAELERVGVVVDDVVTLQATSPFRTGQQVDDAIALMRRTGSDSAVSVVATTTPVSVLGYLDRGTFVPLKRLPDARRQAVPTAYRLTGGIYVTTRGLLRSGRLVGDRPAALEVDGPSAIDIDTREDLEAARRRWRALRAR